MNPLPPSSFRILEGSHQQGSTPGDLFSRVQTTALNTIVPKKLFFKNTNDKQSLCTPFPPPPKIETNIFSSAFFYDRISAHRSVPCVVGPRILDSNGVWYSWSEGSAKPHSITIQNTRFQALQLQTLKAFSSRRKIGPEIVPKKSRHGDMFVKLDNLGLADRTQRS